MPYPDLPNMPRLYSVGDVAKLFQVDPKTVTRWRKTGLMEKYNIGMTKTLGGHWRYYADDVDRYLRIGAHNADKN